MLGDLPVHRYGPASNAKWVLWGHDIFGVLSGWHTINCFATLAHKLFRKKRRRKE